MPLGFTIAGGKESGFGIFISKVRDSSLLVVSFCFGGLFLPWVQYEQYGLTNQRKHAVI